MSSLSGNPSYSTVLCQPSALWTFAAATVGRFSYGIDFLSLLAPLRARLLDRRGPRQVLPVMATVYAALLATLAAATCGSGTSPWRPLVLTLSAGACAPALGPVIRALWSDLMHGPRVLHARPGASFADTVSAVSSPVA